MKPIVDLLKSLWNGLANLFSWAYEQDWFWPAAAAIGLTILLKVALTQLGIKIKPVVLVVVTILITLLAVGIFG